MIADGFNRLRAAAQLPAVARVLEILRKREAAWAVMALALAPMVALKTGAADVTPWNAVVAFILSIAVGVAGATMLAAVEWRGRRR